MHRYYVQTAEQITPSTLLLTIKIANPAAPFSFQPGQYAVISYHRKHRPSIARCFSIVTSPTDQETLQFSMRTRGHYTRSLTKLKPGDVMEVRGPFGGFILDTDRDKRAVLIAGGIGITPFMSMIRYAAATKAENPIDLLYSCADQEDVPFCEELKHTRLINPNFTPNFVVGKGPIDKFEGQRTVQGRITPEVVNNTVRSDELVSTTFFVCGPPPFMKAMVSMLEGMGIQRSQIMTEAFSQGPNRQTGKIRNWPFNMYALTATCFALGSFVVMASDMLKALPPSTLFDSKKAVTADLLTNTRQQDLDSLVNALPGQASTSPSSDQVVAAQKLAAMQSAVAQVTTPSTSSSTSTKTVADNTPAPAASMTATPTPTSTPTPAPTPQPAPKPACKTTQSGVVVC